MVAATTSNNYLFVWEYDAAVAVKQNLKAEWPGCSHTHTHMHKHIHRVRQIPAASDTLCTTLCTTKILYTYSIPSCRTVPVLNSQMRINWVKHRANGNEKCMQDLMTNIDWNRWWSDSHSKLSSQLSQITFPLLQYFRGTTMKYVIFPR